MDGPPDQHETLRMRRVEALRGLAPPEGPQAPPPRSPSKCAIPRVTRAARRGPMVLVVSVLAVAFVAAGMFSWFGQGLNGPKTATTTQPQRPLIIMLPARAGLICPSQPAWSPDGSSLALLARKAKPGGQGICAPYADLVSNVARRAKGISGGDSALTGAVMVVVLDAKTGVLIRTLAPPDPTSALCKDADALPCQGGHVLPASLSWSPDGSSLLVFSQQEVNQDNANGPGFVQTRAALAVMRADGAGTPRLLIARGRMTSAATGPGGGVLTTNLYSPPLFTWDLMTGTASYHDMHERAGVATLDYAPDLQLEPSGRLALASAPATGTFTPWSHGVLWVSQDMPRQGTTFQASGWAWSADGRFVVPNAQVMAVVGTPQPTPTAQPGLEGYYIPPILAPPDMASAAAAAEVTADTPAVYVARDPHDARLASLTCLADGYTGRLTIRATASGKTLATISYAFPTTSSSHGCFAEAEAINWAPDGSRIAMTDDLDNQIVIWRIPASA